MGAKSPSPLAFAQPNALRIELFLGYGTNNGAQIAAGIEKGVSVGMGAFSGEFLHLQKMDGLGDASAIGLASVFRQ